MSAENPSTTSRPRCKPEPGTNFSNATKPNGALELKCGSRVSGARVSAATHASSNQNGCLSIVRTGCTKIVAIAAAVTIAVS